MDSPISRRSLLGGAALAPLAPARLRAASPTTTPLRLAVSTYSYWHFKPEKYSIEKVIEDAARIGFDGVELLHRQFADESPQYMNKLKQLAFRHGLSFPMLSIHQDFVSPEKAERDKDIEHTKHCIDLAAHLGCPAVRLNSGRWKTVKTFDDLMKVKGNEPPLPGYTNDDAFKWCVDSIQACLPHAQQAGVTLCLENHWGLTTSIDMLLRIWRAVDSPWLGINADTGNFPGDPYEGIGKLAPHATIIQAKTYYGGGVWYTLDLDYKRIAGIIKGAGYKGWISLEMEGNEPAATAVPKSFAVLKSAFAS
jgi:L-ribulose-5-phosphate 3-epimerase